MRKTTMTLMTMAFSLVIALGINSDSDAKAKPKAAFKNGTITFSGKGTVTKNIKVKNLKSAKKVKKIVVKKGIKEIANDSFRKYKKIKDITISNSVKKIGTHFYSLNANLNTLTIPGSFEVITSNKSNQTSMLGGNVKKVIFNSNFDIETAAHLYAEEFVTSANDKAFSSIAGSIYTKDKKSLVRVPNRMEELKIANGCEEICTQSFLYSNYYPDDFSSRIRRVVIPASVKKIESTKYSGIDNYTELFDVKVIINTEQLDANSIMECATRLGVSYDDLMYKIPNQIKKKDNFYMSSDEKSLFKYAGTDEKVVVPDGVKFIGVKAFNTDYNIGEVVLPNTVEEIADKAFYHSTSNPLDLKVNIPATVKKIGNKAFADISLKEIELPNTQIEYGTAVFEGSTLKKITIPASMTTIPDEMFKSTLIESVVIPDTVKEIGVSAFESTRLNKVTLGKGLTKISEGAFAYTELDELEVPSNVKTIEDDAFAGNVFNGPKEKLVFLPNNTTSISSYAFDEQHLLSYKKFSDAKTPLLLYSSKVKGKKYSFNFKWSKVKGATAYEVKISSDEKYSKKKTKSFVKKSTAKNLKVNYKVKSVDDYIFVKIRPIKKVGKKTTYGKWVEQVY